MSASRKRKPGKSRKRAQTRIHRKTNGDQVRDSLATELKETRDRWVEISEIVDVTQVALEDGDASLIAPAAASVLFHSVLERIQGEIRMLDGLIEKKFAKAST